MMGGNDHGTVSLWDELACSAPYSVCALMGGASDPNDISAYFHDECVPGRFHHGELLKNQTWDTSAVVLSSNCIKNRRIQVALAMGDVIHSCWGAGILPWSGYCVAVVEPPSNAERYENALRAISERGFDIYADEDAMDVSEAPFKRMPLKTGLNEDGHPRWIWTGTEAPAFLEENRDTYLIAKFVDAFSPVFARNGTHPRQVVRLDNALAFLDTLSNGLLEPPAKQPVLAWRDAPAQYAAYDSASIEVPSLSFDTAFADRAGDFMKCRELARLWTGFLEKYSIAIQPRFIWDRDLDDFRTLRNELGLDSAIDACWNGVRTEYLI